MVFGVIAYFLYKVREKKKQEVEMTYEETLAQDKSEYLFFTKEN